jgi:hypothetical protein
MNQIVAKKTFVPTAAHASRWFALATIALQLVNQTSRDWAELERQAKACGENEVVMFGSENRANPCVQLIGFALSAAASRRPHDYDAGLRSSAEAVIAAYYDWEAGGR